MRTVFHEQLEAVLTDLAEISEQVETSIQRATQALMTGDVALAEQVVSDDEAIDRARQQVEENAFSLLSLQQPVAGDLRILVAALRMVGELERMGDHSVHVARVARRRAPDVAVPQQMQPTIERMAEIAESMVHRLTRIITERDAQDAIAFAAEDEEMDELRRATFTDMLGGDWPHGVEAAIDMALLGRFYERLADHAVSVAARIVYVVTGEVPHRLEEAERWRT